MMGSRTWHCVVSVSFELGTVLSVFPLSALPITSHFTEKKPRLPPRWVASKVVLKFLWVFHILMSDHFLGEAIMLF